MLKCLEEERSLRGYKSQSDFCPIPWAEKQRGLPSNGVEENVGIKVGVPGSPIDRRERMVLHEIQRVSESERLSIKRGGGKKEEG